MTPLLEGRSLKIIACCASLFFTSIFPTKILAQIGLAARLAQEILEDANEKGKRKKAEKLADEYSTYFETANGPVPMLRVPADKLKSVAKENILFVQDELEKANKQFLAGGHVNIKSSFFTYIERIAIQDSYWFTSTYKRELEFYLNYERNLNERERQQKIFEKVRNDSIIHVQKLREKRANDSVAYIQGLREIVLKDSIGRVSEKERFEEENAAYLKRVEGYHFINAVTLNLREKPNPDSKVIGRLGACSYVRIISRNETNGFVKIAVSDYEGYVKNDYLVNNLDKITVPGADIDFAKKYYFASVETKNPSPKYQSHVIDFRTYYRGPKGGCYYINSSGKKVYVDRSLCD